jgi:hypothetical protein
MRLNATDLKFPKEEQMHHVHTKGFKDATDETRASIEMMIVFLNASDEQPCESLDRVNTDEACGSTVMSG